jgi:hypothetical protein
MKHLKTFESFSINEEEGWFDEISNIYAKGKKFVTGHESDEAKEAAKEAFFTELDKIQQENQGNQNFVFNRSVVEKDAKENDYKGHIDARRSARDGKIYVLYVKGVTGLEDVAKTATPTGRQSIA